MSRVFLFTRPSQVDFDVAADRTADAKEVRVRTLFSGTSAGSDLGFGSG